MSSFNVWTTVSPMILLMIWPTPIGWSPGFLSKGISLLAKNASRELVWSDSTHNISTTLARSIQMLAELLPELLDVSILLHPSGVMELDVSIFLLTHLLYAERYFEWLQHLYIHTLSYVWIAVCRRIKNIYQLHFGMSVFALSLSVVQFRDNTTFLMLLERSFMALLISPFFMCSTNFLGSCEIDFGLVDFFLALWIVSAL